MSVAITPQLIKELRDRTGVGIGKCKEALELTSGDVDKAIEHLRKSGMASAVKKEGRSAKEGQIAFVENDKHLVIVEINAETDFVVKNDRFKEFVVNIAEEIARTCPKDVNALLNQKFTKDDKLTIDEYRATLVQAIGENIQVKRFQIFDKKDDATIGIYSHLGGKIVTTVEISGSNKERELANNIAMHIAAAQPGYINHQQVPADIINQEKNIVKTQIKGKPENIIEKIIEGRISKYFDEVCLLRQTYLKDENHKIQDLLNLRAKEIDNSLDITNFTCWSVGQCN